VESLELASRRKKTHMKPKHGDPAYPGCIARATTRSRVRVSGTPSYRTHIQTELACRPGGPARDEVRS